MNKVILVGRLGENAKVNVFDNGNKVTKFSLATSEKYKGKEETSWHNVDIWGEYGENLAKYLTKGKQVLIEGRIQYSKTKKGDTDVYFTTIVADKLELLGSTGGSSNASDNQDDTSSDMNERKASTKTTAPSFSSKDDSDDLPF